MMTVSSSFSSPFYACATMRWALRPGQMSAAAYPSFFVVCPELDQTGRRFSEKEDTETSKVHWYTSVPAPTGSLYRQEFAGSTEITLF